MGVISLSDPAAVLNAKARAQGWPIRFDSELLFDRPELNMLRDVWRSEAARIGVPRRSHFDGQVLSSALRRLTVLERIKGDDGSRRYRIVHQGPYMAALMGDNVGRFIDEGIPAPLLPRWLMLFDAVIDSGTPLRATAEFELDRLRYAVGEGFIAPLANEAGEPNLVLIGAYIRPRDEPDAAA